jgi:ABC-type multidrug transport system ATPase subunit
MQVSTEIGSSPKDSTDAAAVISVHDFTHRYGDRTALGGVSFDVRPAELFGLLGPNGSGKTTMFRILSTLMVPVGGQAVILGHDAAKDPSQLRCEIGVVFQAQSIDLKLTATENLQQQGHLYGLHGSDAAGMEALTCAAETRSAGRKSNNGLGARKLQHETPCHTPSYRWRELTGG